MYHFVRQIVRRFGRDEGGNVFILFGATAIPLLLVMGGAVDVTRYLRYKAELANAVDAASLALARMNPDATEEEADTFITDYVNAFAMGDTEFTEEDIEVVLADDGFQITATGAMQTLFLPLGGFVADGRGINSIPLEITAQVVNKTNRLELALVIDNTGSMNCGNTMSGTCYNNYASPPATSRIVAVKAAATTLVNTLMRDDLEDPEQIKIALVPFEGAVNVGITSGPANGWAQPPSWIAWNTTSSTTDYSLSTTTGYGIGKYNGVDFQSYNFSTNTAGCTPVNTGDCRFMSHGYLFRKVDVLWAGCVQMRPSSATPSLNYELTDITPDPAVPNSLFVPYFWPDEPDSSGSYSGNAAGYSYTNNYLSDLANAPGSGSSRAAAAQAALAKYRPNLPTTATWHSATLKTQGATAGPYLMGPNKGCPNPIVPLTEGDATGKQEILDAIDDMVAYYSTGTYIPTGLIWGWHVLSPTEPFTEGLAAGDDYYEDTIKAMVLFTDGDNTVNTPSGSGHPNGSFYSGWSYVNERDPDNVYRLGSNANNAEAALNTKTAAACENAKAAGIRLYAVSFGSLTTATTNMMSDCATEEDGEPLYYHAPTTADLDDIFVEIGEDLREIHLSM